MSRRSMAMRDNILVCDTQATLHLGIAAAQVLDWNNTVLKIYIQK